MFYFAFDHLFSFLFLFLSLYLLLLCCLLLLLLVDERETLLMRVVKEWMRKKRRRKWNPWELRLKNDLEDGKWYMSLWRGYIVTNLIHSQFILFFFLYFLLFVPLLPSNLERYLVANLLSQFRLPVSSHNCCSGTKVTSG